MIASASCNGMLKNSLPTRVQSLFYLSVSKVLYVKKITKIKSNENTSIFYTLLFSCEKVKGEQNFVTPAPVLVKLMGCGW